MKNKKNLLLVVLLLVVIAVATASTYAWLTQTNSSGEITYTVGDVSYTVTPSLVNGGTVVPGQPLGTFTISNSSNVLTNVRVRFNVSVSNVKNDASTDWSVGTTASDEVLLTQPEGSKWVLVVSGTNYYYYYGGVGDKDATGTEDIAVNSGNLETLFNTLVINGALVGNDYAGAAVKITITFEAKQAEYVDWSEMGSIDFETGIAKTN